MPRPRLAGLTPGRLRLGLGLLFVALVAPTAVLVHHAYGQLKWEAFHRHALLAEEFTGRIAARLAAEVAVEEARAVTDYAFLVFQGDPATRYVTRSPLAGYPVASELPGALGHFQVDADGRFSSPLLPDSGVDASRYGVGPEELALRRAQVARLQELLGRSRLEDETVAGRTPAAADVDAGAGTGIAPKQKSAAPDAAFATLAPVVQEQTAEKREERAPRVAEQKKAQAPTQALFDRLEAERGDGSLAKRGEGVRSLGRVESLPLERRFRDQADAERQQAAPAASAPLTPEPARPARKERNVLPAAPTEPSADDKADAGEVDGTLPIRAFESDVDPFRFALLDAEHFVLYRNVWRDGQRLVQGLLVAREPFLRTTLLEPFAATALAHASDLLVAWRGDVLAAFNGPAGGRYLSRTDELAGTLLHRARPPAPLGDLELLFSVTQLPPGPGAGVLAWVSAALAATFLLGFLGLYRLGLGQIRLVRQQQDFVSAVSHELKTPLTSIRMYGEMLQQGWADEAKRQEYYAYIHGESERLSRLIDNVLQLARVNRNGLRVAAERLAGQALCDLLRSKITGQVERAGFAFDLECDAATANVAVEVDPDLFLQIVINLVDNALKFASGADTRRIEVACRSQRDGIVFSVRDHGPGVPPDQMKKIFRLFYRPGNELTRETVGTGIGLALVHQLVTAMDGTVDVVNRDPGAEFRVSFPVAT